MFGFPRSAVDQIIASNERKEDKENADCEEQSTLMEEDQGMLGCVAITFEDILAARNCQSFFAEQFFCDRKLFSFAHIPTHLIPPPPPPPPLPQPTSLSTNDNSNNEDKMERKIESSLPPPEELTEVVYDEAIQKEVEDVEDFLNSLL